MLKITNGILIAAKIMGIGTFSWWWIFGLTLGLVVSGILSDKVDIYIETNGKKKS